ncbi:MAG: hypothetical protein ACLFWG_00200 [Longimicrobiales bacterium]
MTEPPTCTHDWDDERFPCPDCWEEIQDQEAKSREDEAFAVGVMSGAYEQDGRWLEAISEVVEDSEVVEAIADRAIGEEAARRPEEITRLEYHVVRVREDTCLSPVPWSWLSWTDSWRDPGFPDPLGRYRDGYWKVQARRCPEDHDPDCVHRIRCAWGPVDYWDQEPDPEADYTPPEPHYQGKRVVSVVPAVGEDGELDWVIGTLGTEGREP